MILIDGKKAAAELREELKKEVSELKAMHNKVPGLTVILIGDLTPSQIYVRNKEKSANEVGLKSDVIKYPDTVEEKIVLNKIKELKINIPDIIYVYSQNSASSLLNFIKVHQMENIWMDTNLMCIGEKTSSILNEIKWKKIFLFNPGEEEFLLYKI